MAVKDEIKIDGSAISTSLNDLKTNLDDFEQVLIELSKMVLFAKDDLKGKAYTKLFATVDDLIEQQKDVLIFERIVLEEIESYRNEMGTKEKNSKNKFSV